METMFAFGRQSDVRRAVTLRLTPSALIRREPRNNRMSRTEGVVWAIAECIGERAVGCGDALIAWSKYRNSSVGLLVLAQRCGRFGHSQLFSEINTRLSFKCEVDFKKQL